VIYNNILTAGEEEISEIFSQITPIDDPKEIMKKIAKERLRKCLVFMQEFWKIILFLIQAGIIGGIGLLAYYIE